MTRAYSAPSHRRLYLVCAAVLVLLLLPCAAAADAISITTEADLRNVANDLTASYILENDIVLTEPWTPIGTWTSSLDETLLFTGTFDGNGHTISNVSIVSTNSNGYVGFFGYASAATITNLTLADVNITGVLHVGGIAGGIKEGTVIDSCQVSGTIIPTQGYGGGIVGTISHTLLPARISNCYVAADIGSTAGTYSLGGIAGDLAQSAVSSGTAVITDCYYIGDILSSRKSAVLGGILGSADSKAPLTLSNCYAAGTIATTHTSGKNVGGILGSCSMDSLEISNCVAAQEYLNATAYVAPLVGITDKTITYSDNYAYSGMMMGTTPFTEVTIDPAKSSAGDYLASADALWNTYSTEGNTGVWSGFSTDIWKPNMGNAAYKLPVLKSQDVPVAGDASYLNTAGSGQTKPSASYTKLLTPTPSGIWLINEPVILTASASVGDDLVFTWDMGNGDMVTGAETEYTYTEAGQYTIKLFVENDAGSVVKTTDIVVYDMANPDAAGVPYTVLAYETVDIINGSTIAQTISPISGGYRVGEDYLITPANSVGGMLQTLGFPYDIWRSQKPTPTYSLVNITVGDTLYPNGKYGDADMSWRSYDGMTKAALKYNPQDPVPNGTTVYTVYCPHNIGASVGDPSGGTEYVIVTKLNIIEEGAILPKEVTANLSTANIDLFNSTVSLGDTSKTSIEIPENTPFGALYSLYANELNVVVTDLHFWGGKYTSFTDWQYLSLEDLNGYQHKNTIDGVKYYWDGFVNGEKLNGDLNPADGSVTGYGTALKAGDVVTFAYVPASGDFSTAKELINITVTNVEEISAGPVELYNQTLTIVNGSSVTAKISPISGGYKPGEDTIEFSAATIAGLLNAAGIDYDVWKSQKPIPTYSLTNITFNGTLYANIQVGGDKCWRSFDGMTAAAKKYDVNAELPNGTTIYNVYGDYDTVNSDPSGAEYVIVTTINIEEPAPAPEPCITLDDKVVNITTANASVSFGEILTAAGYTYVGVNGATVGSYSDREYLEQLTINGTSYPAVINMTDDFEWKFTDGFGTSAALYKKGLNAYVTKSQSGSTFHLLYINTTASRPDGFTYNFSPEYSKYLVNLTVNLLEPETPPGPGEDDPVVLYNQTLTIVNGSSVTAKISPISGGYKPGEDTIEFSAATIAGLLNAAGIDYDVWKSQKPTPTYSLTNITFNGTLYANIQVGGDKCWRSFDGMTAAAKKYDVNAELPNGTTIYNVYGDYNTVNSDPSGAEYVIVTTINIEEPAPAPEPCITLDNAVVNITTANASVSFGEILTAAGYTYVGVNGADVGSYSDREYLEQLTINGTSYPAVINMTDDFEWKFTDGFGTSAALYKKGLNAYVTKSQSGSTFHLLYINNTASRPDGFTYNFSPEYSKYLVNLTVNLADPETPPSDPVATTVVLSDVPTASIDLAGSITGTLTAVVKDETGALMPAETVNWASSNTTVLTIDNAGVYTAHAVGTADIIATAVSNSSATVSATVTVIDTTPAPEPCIVLDDKVVNITTANSSVSFGEILTAAGYTYTSVNGADVGSYSDREYLEQLTINGISYPAEVNLTDEFEWKFTNGFGTSATLYKKGLNAYVDKSQSGQTFYLFFIDNSVSRPDGKTYDFQMEYSKYLVNLTVNLNDPVPTSLNITAPAAGSSYNISDNFTAAAIVYDQTGAEMPDAVVVWASSNNNVFSVDGTKFTATGAGNVEIIAECGNATAKIPVVVLPDPVKPKIPEVVTTGSDGTTVIDKSNSNVTVRTEEKKVEIKDPVSNVSLEVSYDDDMETTGNNVSGTVANVVAKYPPMPIVSDPTTTELGSGLTLDVKIDLGTNVETKLPTFKAEINEATKQRIENLKIDGKQYTVGLMLQSEGVAEGFNEKVGKVTLTFDKISNSWLQQFNGKLAIVHTADDGTVQVLTQFLIEDNGDGTSKLTVESDLGFSAYALAGYTVTSDPVTPAADNGGADDGAALLASVGAGAKPTVTAQPTTAPTVVVPTSTVTVQPTGSQQTAVPTTAATTAAATTAATQAPAPAPVFGLLLGLLGAAVLLRRT